mmetsp:Transcript_11762/g.37427  ORF Transcript_11762/g.37427 Transcript_11762/m.37427 type:complete len:432 (-) Transcript_11762:20-1315(-)
MRWVLLGVEQLLWWRACRAASPVQWDEQAESTMRAVLASRRAILEEGPRAIARRGDGVVYAMGGSEDFVAQEVLPTVRYLGRLGRKPASIRYALFTERKLLAQLPAEEAEEIRSWFDSVTTYESVALPAFRREPALAQVRVRVKAIKAHAFLLAPFERFVFLDFDSRPCSPAFAAELVAELRRRRVDALLHNQWPEVQDRLRGDAHHKIEHNSAVAVFDATAPATELALRFFLAAFERMRPRRDQPPLMVALRAARLLANFSHADLPPSAFCRRNATRLVSCDAGCLLVHKPQKYDPGHVVFGLGQPSHLLALLLAALKIRNRPDHPCDDPFRGRDDLACRLFQGPDLARRAADLARRWPRAKFVALLDSSLPPQSPPPDDALLDPARLFVLDLHQARRDDRVWRRFCSFLEVWSSCKVATLAALVRAPDS